MERVEVRLNLEVPRNSRLYEVRQLIVSRFENVHWLDLCEDDNRVSDDKRPLIASITRVTSELGSEFIADGTFPDWSTAEPGTDIEKSWRVRNNGLNPWPPGTCLRQCWGDLGKTQTAFIPDLDVGEEGEIRLPISLPTHNGVFQTQFRLFHPDYGYFGHKFWCNLILREESSVQILDDLDVELPPCFDIDYCEELPRRQVQSSPTAFRHKPRQEQYRLEAEALPEAFITGALSACSSIFNVAKALIEPRPEHRPSSDR